MIFPIRRIWLYPIAATTLEIVILGDESIAAIYADIRARAESWPGWARVDTIVSGVAGVLGIRVELSNGATSDDPIVEAIRMLKPLDKLEWSSHMGMVASW